jgi:hypothetical protein
MKCVSIAKPSRLMSFRELCGQNGEFFIVKTSGIESVHAALKGLMIVFIDFSKSKLHTEFSSSSSALVVRCYKPVPISIGFETDFPSNSGSSHVSLPFSTL